MAHFKNPSGLAHALAGQGVSISPQAIYKWQRQGIPIDRVPAIEAASDGKITCESVFPSVEWARDRAGAITGYKVRVAPQPKAKREAA